MARKRRSPPPRRPGASSPSRSPGSPTTAPPAGPPGEGPPPPPPLAPSTTAEQGSTAALEAVLARHGLKLPQEQTALLDRYCRLLWAWNQQLNLTRHTDYERFVGRDLVDTLQLAALLAPEEKVLDVGTGGGVPGLVLAIVRPDLAVTLCDSVQKKARAVAGIVQALGLKVPVLPWRAEQVLKDQRFDTLVFRAVGPLPRLLADFRRLWPRFRRMLVIKGPRYGDELAEARRRGLLRGLSCQVQAAYPLPQGVGKSVVLEIRPASAPGR